MNKPIPRLSTEELSDRLEDAYDARNDILAQDIRFEMRYRQGAVSERPERGYTSDRIYGLRRPSRQASP